MLMSLLVVSGFATAQENETTIDTSVTWEADGGLLTCDYDHVRIMDYGWRGTYNQRHISRLDL